MDAKDRLGLRHAPFGAKRIARAGERFVGARRRPPRGALVAALALVALSSGGVVGHWLSSALVELELAGEWRHVDRERVAEALSAHRRRGFLRADTGAMRRAVESLPWVRSAEVRRAWSRWAISVNVAERRALARWRGGGLVDADGEPFDPPGGVEPALRLGGPPGRRAEVVGSYWELRRVFAGDPAFRITALELDGLHGWRVAFPGMDAMLGHGDPAAGARRMLSLLRAGLLDRRKSAERIDLRYPNGVAVR